MKFNEFINEVKERISARMGDDRKVTTQPVVKNNGTVYEGLIILDPVLNISPTIYLNPFYNKFLNGVSMEDIIDDILKIYYENRPEEDFDISSFKDIEKVCGRIIMKVVNTERNKTLLQDVPNRAFHDLSIVYNVMVYDFMGEFATVLINNQHMEYWGVTEEDLYKVATENTPKYLSYRFESMDNMLERLNKLSDVTHFDLNMYILTNKIKIHGATCIAYPGMLKRISNFLEDNLVIIPSSIHEVLIIPENVAKSECTFEELRDMVKEVNTTELEIEEILSDHVYFYNRETMEITF